MNCIVGVGVGILLPINSIGASIGSYIVREALLKLCNFLADTNAKNEEGSTPLILAAARGHFGVGLEIVDHLDDTSFGGNESLLY